MPRIVDPYQCPRCGYESKVKRDMHKHLYDLKNECPNKYNVVLTDEIRSEVMDSRFYNGKTVDLTSFATLQLDTKLNSKQGVTSTVKERKNPINKKLRKQVWITYMGNVFEGKCMCCETTNIDSFDFHCGHILAHANGGPADLENLRPVCMGCNLSMRTTNLYQFKSMITKKPENVATVLPDAD